MTNAEVSEFKSFQSNVTDQGFTDRNFGLSWVGIESLLSMFKFYNEYSFELK